MTPAEAIALFGRVYRAEKHTTKGSVHLWDDCHCLDRCDKGPRELASVHQVPLSSEVCTYCMERGEKAEGVLGA